ncbi:MAG: molybdopterin synthase catalytic subunit [Rhodothermales bacterium]|jgi:molybdopterin synthase catalytic subunit
MFTLDTNPLQPVKLTRSLLDRSAGGFVSFEGWVRDHNEGRDVTRLEYEAYSSMAEKEGAAILAEAREKFDIVSLACVHRIGLLEIGELAVWVGVSAVHRGPAFDACQYVINQVKVRVPVWKKEYYSDGDSGWVNCAHCAAHAH